jgi:phage gp36-like protein
MIFLTDTDLGPQIRTEVLTVVRGSTTNQDTIELAAIAEMQSYLRGKYDVAAIFAATGSDRNAQLVMYCVDILLYHLHSNITPRNVPEIRKQRYDAAIHWLKMVASDKLNPDLPEMEGQTSGDFKLGSNTKVSRQW